jgi:hypothetical protein
MAHTRTEESRFKAPGVRKEGPPSPAPPGGPGSVNWIPPGPFVQTRIDSGDNPRVNSPRRKPKEFL